MAQIATMPFTAADTTVLSSLATAEGDLWTRNSAIQGQYIIRTNRAYPSTAGLIYPNRAPLTADYSVFMDLHVLSKTGVTAIAGRIQAGANTAYYAYNDMATNVWVLAKVVAGTVTVLANSASQSLTVGQTYAVELRMAGTSIHLYVGGSGVYTSTTDSSISAAGFGGLRATGAVTTTTGAHVDNFRIVDTSVVGVVGKFTGAFV